MTEKLYMTDPYLRQFRARVLSCREKDGKWLVELDRTAFYPEGGGQPWDLGELTDPRQEEDARVLEVHEKEGVVYHTTDRPLAGEVVGTIDWDRRFALMQQHSGEHLVSGLAHRLYGCENVGFHMGAQAITIDLDRVLRWDQLQRIEYLANEAIWQNLETNIRSYESEAACPEDYRSKKAISGPLRLVEFPGVDLCACCGTHVARTGEIGLIKLLSAVKFHQGIRIEMLCGQQALAYVSRVVDQNRAVSGLLSAKPMETAGAVERVLGELNQTKQEKAAWEARCFDYMARDYAGAGDLVLFEEGLSPDSLRRLCVALMEVCGGRCAVFSGSDEAGWAYALGRTGGDLRDLVKDMNAALQGRGGGKPYFAQGRVQAKRREIERFFQK